MPCNNEKATKIWYNLVERKNHTNQILGGLSMNHYTTDVYEVKRENILFSKKLTKGLNQVESKFITQMIYGMTKSQSVILSNIADGLKEDIKKVNTVERLSRNLDKPLSNDLLYENYMKEVNKVIGEEPV